MANNKYFNGPLTPEMDWGGDEKTGNLPASGKAVQDFIKEQIDSKAGYLGTINTTSRNYYVLAKDKDSFDEFSGTVDDEHPNGNPKVEGIIGTFDAPFQYKMDIEIIEPKSNRKSSLLGSVGNKIVFRTVTRNISNAIVPEDITITYKIKNGQGVETTFYQDKNFTATESGIEYNVDDYLTIGENVVTIMTTGKLTNASAMARVTFNVVNMYIKDSFKINDVYSYGKNETLSISVPYEINGVGQTRIYWYIDGELEGGKPEEMGIDYNNNRGNKIFYYELKGKRLEPVTLDENGGIKHSGVHTLQFYVECDDSNDETVKFQSPVYYREFIVKNYESEVYHPILVRKLSYKLDEHEILKYGETPVIYDSVEFDKAKLDFYLYHSGKETSKVNVKYKFENDSEWIDENITVNVTDGEVKTYECQVSKSGQLSVVMTPVDGEQVETLFKVKDSGMDIETIDDNVSLFLSAFSKNNDSENPEKWEYVRSDGSSIKSQFSHNGYVDSYFHYDSNEKNTKVVDTDPSILSKKVEGFKYLLYKDTYYIWEKDFEWSKTSGWNNNALMISNENSLTIDYKPFSSIMGNIEPINDRGGTFEFVFRSINVSNDDAVLCSICDPVNGAPGIILRASQAELILKKNSSGGYDKSVNTRFKAGDLNRISFVITPKNNVLERSRMFKVYVNGVLCGAESYTAIDNFSNESKIIFRGSEEAEIELHSIKFYDMELSSYDILNNYIFYQESIDDKLRIYDHNNILLPGSHNNFDQNILKEQLPVMIFKQLKEDEGIEIIHNEKEDKKKTVHFDVLYEHPTDKSLNFYIQNACIRPQGTSSMAYPVKNFRIYTTKDKENPATLYVGENIFIKDEVSGTNTLNPDTLVPKKKYSFKNETKYNKKAAPVKAWCLKADYAESSSSHNTGTARYWNDVLVNAGYTTKAQKKAKEIDYKYDVRTCIDGFPIVLFYQSLAEPNKYQFQGKYNFNNDKSTEDVFGFTGGEEVPGAKFQYNYIGTEPPVYQLDDDGITPVVWFEEDGYDTWSKKLDQVEDIEDLPVYVSKKGTDGQPDKWYMIRGKETFDNPYMECWEFRNSTSDLGLFKSMKGLTYGTKSKEDKDHGETIGLVTNGVYEEAFESRFPDCGDYYNPSELKRFMKWMVSCRYLKVVDDPEDDTRGICVPCDENDFLEFDDWKKGCTLHIESLTKKDKTFEFNFIGHNFYKKADESMLDLNGVPKDLEYPHYVAKHNLSPSESAEATQEGNTIELPDGSPVPEEILPQPHIYIKIDGVHYKWTNGNYQEFDELPNNKVYGIKYAVIGKDYYYWDNVYKYEDFWEGGSKCGDYEDNAFNRALKFQVEKWDYLDMEKVAAYYVFLMRFGAVDQTVKNAMLTTEGPDYDIEKNPTGSTLPSKWFFINYDNDTILGVKNDGHLVFDPYITRETKDGKSAYVYAGRDSTFWNNLEMDSDFNGIVTKVDGKLSSGSELGKNLNYANAINYYTTTQTSKWCERIYNEDAEKKYISKYITGWLDNNGNTQPADYLYDVQGSRDAHRKWWLSRRYNIFDSKFANNSFLSHSIELRSDSLPAGRKLKIKSGEPVYYAWGHNNSIVEITPSVVKSGEEYSFVTPSYINIGSPFKMFGAHNIAVLDIRDAMENLTRCDVTNAYSEEFGTKLVELLIGDHNRPEIVAHTDQILKLGGLSNANKLRVLDLTGMKNLDEIPGLNSLKQLEELYAFKTNVANFDFAEGAKLRKIELPRTLMGLSMSKLSDITYEDIKVDGDDYTNLMSLVINDCHNLMDNYHKIFDWLNLKRLENGEYDVNKLAQTNLVLHGINWKFTDATELQDIYVLEHVGGQNNAIRNISGKIYIDDTLSLTDVRRLRKLFGANCFNDKDAKVYITANKSLYVIGDEEIIEGDGEHTYDFIKVNIDETLDENGKPKGIFKSYVTNGLDEDISFKHEEVIFNKKNNYCTLEIKENDIENIEKITVSIEYSYESSNGTVTTYASLPVTVKDRTYPANVTINGKIDLGEVGDYKYITIFEPEDCNGIIDYEWSLSGDASLAETHDGKKILSMTSKPSDKLCSLRLIQTYDGFADLTVKLSKHYNGETITTKSIQLALNDPSTLFTPTRNPEIYNILVKENLPHEMEGKFTKTDVSRYKESDLIKNGKSIFAENKEITTFNEFKYFAGLKNVPDGMFKGCDKLTEISLKDNIKFIGSSAFSGCSALKKISGQQDETIIVEEIRSSAFYSCRALETFEHSSNLKTIEDSAFQNCNSLKYFVISNGIENIAHVNGSNVFSGCPMVTFKGGNSKFIVDKGNLYEDAIDKKHLIHMGARNTVDTIIKDEPIYASSYSMEYREEDTLTVPTNIIFNGSKIFNNSVGNKIILTNIIGNSICDGLFNETNYKSYNFAHGETKIPNSCFNNCLCLETFVVPEGIVKLGNSCFYACRKLKNVILPKTLKQVGGHCFWLCSLLKNVYVNSSTSPEIMEDEFFDVMLNAIYVNPSDWDSIMNTINDIYKPFIKPNKLYSEGYVRIIENGSVKYIDKGEGQQVPEVVIGDNITGTMQKDGYIKYTYSGDSSNISIVDNGVNIGSITEKYTTIYLGDNSSLFSGEGIDFTIGEYAVSDSGSVPTIDNKNNWKHDVRVKGIVNNNIDEGKTELIVKVPYYSGKTTPVCYGHYSNDDSYTLIKNNNNDQLLKVVNTPNFNVISNITTQDGTIKMEYNKNKVIKTGLNGFVLNKVGNVVYSDPEIQMPLSRSTSVKTIELSIEPQEGLVDVPIVITDKMGNVYGKLWKGSPVTFNVFADRKYYVMNNNILTSNGKSMFIKEFEIINDKTVINYEFNYGIKETDDVIHYSSADYDYYILKQKQEPSEWGTYSDENHNSDVFTIDSDGWINSNYHKNDGGIFEKAHNFALPDKSYVGYIPSYNDLEIVKSISNLSFEDVWTSDSFNNNEAWANDGKTYDKSTKKAYYIFGRKITM